MLRYWVQLPQAGRVASARNVRAYAALAEELGFTGVWLGDHIALPESYESQYPYGAAHPVASDRPFLEALTTLAYVAGATRSIRLAVAVLVAPYRHPLLQAKQIATLDALSGGRLEVGFGAGWLAEEFEALDVSYDDRQSLTDETLDVMKKLWSGEAVRHEGRHFRLDGVRCLPLPAQRPWPPLWIGGISPRALRRVVETGSGWLAPAQSVAEVGALVSRLRELAAGGGARAPDGRPRPGQRLAGGRRGRSVRRPRRVGGRGRQRRQTRVDQVAGARAHRRHWEVRPHARGDGVEGDDLNLGRIGVWLGSIGLLPAALEREAVRELESLGFGTLWIGESQVNREALSHAALLLGWTDRITIATGIASIWARDAVAAGNGAASLAEAHPDRFVLGLGVSHPQSVARRGHRYSRPLGAMRDYLDAIDASDYRAAPPARRCSRVLAALAPAMLSLAAERAEGAHPYLVTPEHTARARAILGDACVLAPEQGFHLATDAEAARAVARRHLRVYLGAENYRRSWELLGFGDADWRAPGSDRLVDALVALGDEAVIVDRVEAHLAAGADHVAVQALGPEPIDELRRLARALDL